MRSLGKYSRSVSVIGVGATPYRNAMKDPEMMGLSESELFGYAAIEAMKDAGISPKDIQFYIHGQAGAVPTSDQNAHGVQVNDWFGCRGLGAIGHSEACCTGYMGLDMAVQAVASGKYDFVLSGAVDMGCDSFVPDRPGYFREKLGTAGFSKNVERVYDRNYTRWFECGQSVQQDDFVAWYMKEYGLSEAQMDDVLNMLAISNRHSASVNPRAMLRTEFADEAKAAGYDNVMDYMRSDEHNPRIGGYVRRFHMEARSDGAACCVVCPTEMAKDFKQTPIEVLGVGNSIIEAMHPHLELFATREAIRQVYEVTGLQPADIDLLLVNDFFLPSSLLAAEEAGYLPRGEGWKYILEGHTAYDGDKPINSSGGRCSFGHAHAASGMQDIFEAVIQMRGQAGAHAIKKLPRTTMLRGFGGGQNLLAAILRTAE